MAEENTVKIDTVADFFSEEYGWIGAHKSYDVRADVAERWISEGKALAGNIENAEKKN
jgi:hypothetical protein